MSLVAFARAIASGEEFGKVLRRYLESRGISPIEFSKKAGIPYSTLYKVLKGKKPSYETLVKVFKTLEAKKNFIALIASRYVLEDFKFDEVVKPYPVVTLEDAIVSAVRAEKDGAKAIVCAPILSGLVERMVDIPVVTMKPRDSILKAVEQALKKVGIS